MNLERSGWAAKEWVALLEYLESKGWKVAQWQENGVPVKMPLTMVSNKVNPDAGLSGWGFKPDNWTYALRVVDEEDGVVFNTDWEHTIFPVDVFLMPFVAYEFTKRKDLGIVLTNLRAAFEGTPTAKDQAIAENVWNSRMLAAESRIGTTALYGPGIVRLAAMRNFCGNTSKIEDSATAQEILKQGYKTDFAPGITMGVTAK